MLGFRILDFIAQCVIIGLFVALAGVLITPLIVALRSRKPSAPNYYTWNVPKAIVVALLGFGLVGGFFVWWFSFMRFHPLEGGAVFFDSLKYTIPLAALFLGVTLKLIRRSCSKQEISVLVVCSFAAFALLGAGLEIVLNSRLDTAAPSSHKLRVIDKYIRQDMYPSPLAGPAGYQRSNYIVTESWRGVVTETFQVDSATNLCGTIPYYEVMPHTTSLIVQTKPGRFGFEWGVSCSAENLHYSP